jgi:hypothetical protein
MVASSASGKTPLWLHQGLQCRQINNRLKVSYFSNYPKHIPDSYMKVQSEKDQVTVPFTPASGVDPLALDSSLTANLLPRLACIHKQINRKLQTCISYINHGLDVRIKHKSNANI